MAKEKDDTPASIRRKLQSEEPVRLKKLSKRKQSREVKIHKWRRYLPRPHISHKNQQLCYNKPSYAEKFDAYYCSLCEIWLSRLCKPDKNCTPCLARPANCKKWLAQINE